MILQELLQKYPKIFSKGDYSVPSTWIPIVDKLCSQLEHYLHIHANAESEFELYCVQMKEKFGELRFYVNTEDDIISTLIDYASYKSRSICQECGSIHNIKVYGPWLTYLCEEHATEEIT